MKLFLELILIYPFFIYYSKLAACNVSVVDQDWIEDSAINLPTVSLYSTHLTYRRLHTLLIQKLTFLQKMSTWGDRGLKKPLIDNLKKAYNASKHNLLELATVRYATKNSNGLSFIHLSFNNSWKVKWNQCERTAL